MSTGLSLERERKPHDSAQTSDLNSCNTWNPATCSSSLHLDDLQSPHQEFAQSAISFDQIPSGRAARRSAPPETKRREHVRLFKEYIACCRGPDGRSESSPDPSIGASICDEDDDECFGRALTASTEYGSFLRPHNRRHGSRSTACRVPFTAATAAAAAAACSNGDSAQSRRGGAASPASDCSHDSPIPRDGARSRPAALLGSSPSGSESAVEESKVYRSQVATALKAGRTVWL